MTKLRTLFAVLFVAAALSLPFLRHSSAQSMAPTGSSATSSSTNDPKLVYPVARKVEQVDDYFGTKVYDPYRWLEDETSPETKAWVDEQNRLTFGYLATIPLLEKLKKQLTELYNSPRIGAPFHYGDTYFFTKNDGLQNQSVYY